MKIKNFAIYLILAVLIGYSAYLYRGELGIRSELNDNTFQFAMVQQMEGVVDLVFQGKLPLASLVDNWNPIWGQGAPLALYYNHLPQLATVLSYKIVHPFVPNLSLFIYFEIVKYIFLILTPLSFFLAAGLLGFSSLASLAAASLSALIFTYGSYGLDSSSYLFAGFGLTSQLMASFFMPLAFGFSYKYITSKKFLFLALVFNFLTIESHLGVGTILLISEAILIITFFHLGGVAKRLLRGGWLFGLVFLTNAYFLIPTLLNDAYRNFSHWEGLWKFNSFGWQKVLADFLNGAWFDYNRLPILTILIIIGFFVALIRKTRYLYLVAGLTLWLLLFFGRSTWGQVFDFLPGLSDFYLHRFILGVHFFGIFLAALGLEFLLKKTRLPLWATLTACIVFFWFVSLPVRNYAQNNHQLILSANANFALDEPDWQQTLAFVQEHNSGQSRIYAGTPGGWGGKFTVGQTPVYQRLSVANLPVMNFYAHSWSLSSETEPFFNDQSAAHYSLYNVGFIIAPEGFDFPLAKKAASFGKYQVFSTPNTSYFSLGLPGPAFVADKHSFINLVHQWQGSGWLKAQLYPLLNTSTPNFKMLDLNNYLALSGEAGNLWQNPPFAATPPVSTISATIAEQPTMAHQRFSAQVTSSCSNCLLVLKQTYHPNWQATIDGERSRTTMVFPAFIAIPLPSGSHQVVFEYRPSAVKIPLALLGLVILGFVLFRRQIL